MSEVVVGLASVSMEERPRRRRSAEERRLIVEETFEAGASVARVARKHGINANQVFQWRRLYREGRLSGERPCATHLLPVTISEGAEISLRESLGSGAGAIHIEFPGRALVSVEGRVDPALVRSVLESLRP